MMGLFTPEHVLLSLERGKRKNSHLRVVKESEVIDRVLVCPYCMQDVSCEQSGCCGESSAHFSRAYILENEAVLEHECEIVKGERDGAHGSLNDAG